MPMEEVESSVLLEPVSEATEPEDAVCDVDAEELEGIVAGTVIVPETSVGQGMGTPAE
mgnify:CR=1 FL=1